MSERKAAYVSTEAASEPYGEGKQAPVVGGVY